MNRGDIYGLADNPLKFVLLLEDPSTPYGEVEVEVAPLEIGQMPGQTDRDLQIPAGLLPGFNSAVFVSLWNSRRAPVSLLGTRVSRLPRFVGRWIAEVQRASIVGGEVDVPAELLGTPIQGEDDTRRSFQRERVRRWNRLLSREGDGALTARSGGFRDTEQFWTCATLPRRTLLRMGRASLGASHAVISDWTYSGHSAFGLFRGEREGHGAIRVLGPSLNYELDLWPRVQDADDRVTSEYSPSEGMTVA